MKSTETLNITDVEKNTFNQVTLEDIAKGLGGISSALVGNKTYYASNGNALVANVEATLVWGAAPTKV